MTIVVKAGKVYGLRKMSNIDNIKNYTVIDLEMTGLSAKNDKIIEIGAARVRGGEIVDTISTLVNPKQHIPQRVQELTGITDSDVENAADMDEAVDNLLNFIGDDIILGQNVTFDYSFLKQWAVNHKRTLSLNAYDTLKIARKCLPAEQSKRLEDLCEYFGVNRENAHRALDDAIETKQIFEKLLALMDEKGEPVESKPLVYKAKKQTPATAHQVRQLRELMAEYGIADVISWDNLTRSQASRLYDEYRSKYINRCVDDSQINYRPRRYQPVGFQA